MEFSRVRFRFSSFRSTSMRSFMSSKFIFSEFTAEYVLEKLLQTKATLHKALDQDFTQLKRDLQETMKDRTIYKQEFDMNKLLMDVPIYQPHDSTDFN